MEQDSGSYRIRFASLSDIYDINRLLKVLSPHEYDEDEAGLMLNRLMSHRNGDFYFSNWVAVTGPHYLEEVVGTISLLILPSLSYGGKYFGQIENVVVDPDFQGQGVGKLLVHEAISHACIFNCYKIILDCKDELVDYYSQFGFERSGSAMKMKLI